MTEAELAEVQGLIERLHSAVCEEGLSPEQLADRARWALGYVAGMMLGIGFTEEQVEQELRKVIDESRMARRAIGGEPAQA